jgi:hypothetical protein
VAVRKWPLCNFSQELAEIPQIRGCTGIEGHELREAIAPIGGTGNGSSSRAARKGKAGFYSRRREYGSGVGFQARRA